jgi:hypothetical protein
VVKVNIVVSFLVLARKEENNAVFFLLTMEGGFLCMLLTEEVLITINC